MLAERADSLIGAMLGKNYRVVERIGNGGMAAVYLVEHQTLLKRFAAKVLSTELASSLEARARFTQEAHAASQLDHENIVTINDFGVTGDHRPFFVMELLRGKTLDQRLAEGPMTIEEVVAVAVPVARALAHAHAEGIVHRDVKPENIFLVQRSQGRWGVKVVDFGIAKTPINPKLTKTKTGETLGSPLFMAPEMIRGEDDVDQRVDVYSFGVVLYLMLCGRLPFVDDNLLKVMHMHLSSPPPAPRAVNPGLSVELAEIVDRALAKHPDDRYPSMEALLVDLEAALPMGSDRMLIEAQSGASLNETPFAGALAMSRTGQRPVALPQSQRTSALLPAAPQRSRVPLVIALAAVAVAVVGAAGWYQLGVRSATTSARSDAAAAVASRSAQADTHAGATGHARSAAGATDRAAGHVENAAATIDPTARQVETAAGATDTPTAHAENAAGATDSAAAAVADVAAPESPSAGGENDEAKAETTSPAAPSTAHAAPVRVATVAPLRPARPASGRTTPSKKVVPPARPALRRGQKPSAAAAPAAGQVTTADETATPTTESSAAAQDAAPGSAPVANTEGARAGSETAAPSAPAAPPAAPPAATPAPASPAAPPPGAPIAGAAAPAPTAPSAAKPAAAAPSAPRTLDAVPEIASFELQGSLPSSVARRSVERALPGLRACYSAAARASKTAPAIDLPLGLEIDENGIATHVTLGDVRFGAFSRCAAGVANQIHAPQAPDVGTVRVTTVIKFRPL